MLINLCACADVIFFPPAVTTVSVPAVLSVAEGEGTVQVCVTLTIASNLAEDITVTLSTSDDTGMCVQGLALPCMHHAVCMREDDLFLQRVLVLIMWQ